MRAWIASHVPTGTVLFTTRSAGFFASFATWSATASTALTSAAPSGPAGVRTVTKYASDSSKGGVTRPSKLRRPAFSLRRTRSARPGS